MAEKVEKLERTYNIPLRSKFIRAPSYKKAKRAVNAVKEFMQQHMKADDVKIGPELNKKIWERGIKHPPHHVKVKAVKEANVVRVELEGIEFKSLQPKKKQEKKTGLKGKLEELTKGKEEKKPEKETKEKSAEKKEDKKTTAKEEKHAAKKATPEKEKK